MSMYGTLGSYEEQVKSKVWVTKDLGTSPDVTELLSCTKAPPAHKKGEMARVTSSDGTHLGVSGVHDAQRLPREFAGLPNGHNGSHQFLVHDFITACETGKLPPNNVWQATRYLIPGLVAHDSAMQGGVLTKVPDLGDPPA